MRRALALLLLAFILLSVAVTWFGIQELLHPPFTDKEIAASFVDTWEPSALVTFVILILQLIVLGVSFLAAYRVGPGRLRHLAMTSIVLVLVASGITYRNHAALTERTTRITGQVFGPFHGLF